MLTVPVFSASDAPLTPVDGAVVPYRTCGADRQYLAFAMEPGDVVCAERTAFVAASGGVSLTAQVMTRSAGSWLGLLLTPFRWLGQAFGRVASGEAMWTQVIRAEAAAELVLGNPKGGQIIMLPLRGERITVVRGAWIAHTGDVAVSLTGPPAWWAGMVTSAKWWWQSATGDGDVFFAANGHAVVRALGPGERLYVDAHCLLAWTGTPVWRPAFAATMRGAVFGGEDFAFLDVEGPCMVVVDTAPGRHSPPADPHKPGRRRSVTEEGCQ